MESETDKYINIREGRTITQYTPVDITATRRVSPKNIIVGLLVLRMYICRHLYILDMCT